jgi:pSer/pThr/pTyr-binding forkhead associated (FHA) protein
MWYNGAAMSALLVLTSVDRKVSFTVSEGQTLKIGRSPTCDVAIDSLFLGAWQATVRASGGVVVLEPAPAPTGTFLNNFRVIENQVLKPGDELALGGVVFNVSAAG